MIHRSLSALARKSTSALLIAEAYARTVRLERQLRTSSFAHVLARIEVSRQPLLSGVAMSDMLRAERYARRIMDASRLQLSHTACLHRALVLHQWLRSERIPSQLMIGVMSAEGSLEAHAWVEVDGVPVLDKPQSLSAFTALAPAGLSAAVTARQQLAVPAEGDPLAVNR